MCVALYSRVSTTDKDQDPETQLLPIPGVCCCVVFSPVPVTVAPAFGATRIAQLARSSLLSNNQALQIVGWGIVRALGMGGFAFPPKR